MKNKCAICQQEIGELPMSIGSSSPALLIVPKDEYDDRVVENADQCLIDDDKFFIRGHIEIPVLGNNDSPFTWSVWVSLSEQSFERMSDQWEKEGRENGAPYFGWLMTKLPGYPDTLQLKTNVQDQPVGMVPLITLEPTDHPLSLEQQNGITMARVHEIAHQALKH